MLSINGALRQTFNYGNCCQWNTVYRKLAPRKLFRGAQELCQNAAHGTVLFLHRRLPFADDASGSQHAARQCQERAVGIPCRRARSGGCHDLRAERRSRSSRTVAAAEYARLCRRAGTHRFVQRQDPQARRQRQHRSAELPGIDGRRHPAASRHPRTGRQGSGATPRTDTPVCTPVQPALPGRIFPGMPALHVRRQPGKNPRTGRKRQNGQIGGQRYFPIRHGRGDS